MNQYQQPRVESEHDAPFVVEARPDLPVSSNVTNACSNSNIDQIEQLATNSETHKRHEDVTYDDKTSISEDTSSIFSSDEHDVNDSDNIEIDDESAFNANEFPNLHEDDILLYNSAQITVGEIDSSSHSTITTLQSHSVQILEIFQQFKNTDGAPRYKSKKYSIWLFNLVINDLPYKQRMIHNNILTPGIWFGQSDPLVHLFLAPLHSQLSNLHRGFDVIIPSRNQIRHVKEILLCGTGDAPARSDFLEEHVTTARAITLGNNDDPDAEVMERCGIKSLSPLFNMMSDPIQMIAIADAKLNKFEEQCETSYGRRYMTFNIHSLLHLPQVVQDLGPL
ncbi:hypothetical protein PV326_008667 [Microctonus aethiopoides]|nr:hypothetical protein PV326_008667 [Microctonus aethiopoides]